MTAVLPSTLDRAAWLAERRTGIGGSDAAAVLGLSKWKTPLDVYREKRGEVADEPPTPAMFWGTTLEPVLRDVYAQQTGRVVRVPTTLLRHPAYPFMVGTIDGVTEDSRLLELKTARSGDGWGEEGTDEIPEAYLCQVQHYLAITGLIVADVAVLIGGSDFRVYEVPADVEFQGILTDEEATFWANLQAGIPPEPRTLAEVQQRFRLSESREVVASGDILGAALGLLQAKANLETLKAQADEFQATICKFMGEADTLVCNGKTLATWKTAKGSARLDTAALKAAHPDLCKTFTVTGEPSRRFLLKEPK